jgi:hypothetical protein
MNVFGSETCYINTNVGMKIRIRKLPTTSRCEEEDDEYVISCDNKSDKETQDMKLASKETKELISCLECTGFDKIVH